MAGMSRTLRVNATEYLVAMTEHQPHIYSRRLTYTKTIVKGL